MTMTLVATTTVTGSPVGNILFSSIPQTATDLVLYISARSGDSASIFDDMRIQFNSDNTAANYSYRSLLGSGSAASSTSATDHTYVVPQSGSTATANTFGNGFVYIPNYTSSNQKAFSSDSVSENNATAARQGLFAAKWTGTAAITSVNFRPGASASEIAIGSTVSLYTITKGSGGASVA